MSPMHLDDGLIQQLVDAELTPASAAAAREHLAACAECRDRVAAARQEDSWVFQRLQALDHPSPRVAAADVIGSIDRRPRRWGRLAASIAGTLGVAGAAYAAPGSPLPELVGRMSTWMRGDNIAPAIPAARAAESVTGGAALAAGDRLEIVFSNEQPGGVAIVSLTDARVVEVRAIDGTAAFTLDPDRISVNNAASSARFEVDIPSNAPLVEIRVGSRRILTKDAARVVTETPRDPDGRYRLLLSNPRP